MCSRRPHNELHRQSAGPGALFPGKQLAQLRYSQIARRIFGIDYYRHVSRLSKSSVTEAHACPTENQGGDHFHFILVIASESERQLQLQTVKVWLALADRVIQLRFERDVVVEVVARAK